MKTLKIEAELIIDDQLMYGGDNNELKIDVDAKWWFYNQILTDKLIVHSNEIGDEIGTLKILKINKNKR